MVPGGGGVLGSGSEVLSGGKFLVMMFLVVAYLGSGQSHWEK